MVHLARQSFTCFLVLCFLFDQLSSAFDMLRQPRVSLETLMTLFSELEEVSPRLRLRVEIEGTTLHYSRNLFL